ncbi:hypothetical protein CHS0354_037077 [Potamilus streckersoni]|uniref:Fido domain-containing protein n=1 Tax=Potamilus streckersoni TaxID=2493646 RepID=A0AAE0SQZ8_9BIVA|nr:hypothetical protein CHS0354_037077 [Potamilus streckersoni]
MPFANLDKCFVVKWKNDDFSEIQNCAKVAITYSSDATLAKYTNMAICKRYLDFKPTENPEWRTRVKEDYWPRIPTISQMISDILKYRKKYFLSLSNNTVGRLEKDKADGEILIKFLLKIQQEENIGWQDKGKTEEVINSLDALELDETARETERHASGCTQDSTDREENTKGRKTDINYFSRNVEQFKLPCYSCHGDTEDAVASTYESICQTRKPTKEEQETINLYGGYKHIAKEVHQMQMEEEDISNYLGLMDVETCILKTHKILMYSIMDDLHTGPGKFSTKERQASFSGITHVYPHFATEESVYAAVLMLVDKYNEMIYEISKIPESEENEEEKLQLSFKCASLFLFGFLTLHPFGDGNGRLARLLCSYSLLTFSPFPTPIYNVFNSTVEEDYVQALVVARKDLKISEMINTEDKAKQVTDTVLSQKPSELCALIIESNWSMWRQYLHTLGIEKIEPYKWETGY